MTWGDAPRVAGAALVALVVAAGLATLRLLPWLSSIRSFDQRAARAVAVDRDSAPGALAAVTAAVTSPTLIVLAAMIVAAGRLRRWKIWPASLLLIGSVVLVAVTVSVGQATWGLALAPEASRPSAPVAFVVVLGGGLALSDLDQSAFRTAVLWTSTGVLTAATGWSRVAIGTDRLSDAIAGVILGTASLIMSWQLVTGIQLRHLDRALAHELSP